MKKILPICLLLLIAFTDTGAQVVVYLQGKYLDELLNLDSIVVENTTQYDRMVLPAPPQINTYAIDLVKGIIINGEEDKSVSQAAVSMLFNRPGQAGILLALQHREAVVADLFDLSGRLVHRWQYEVTGGRYRFDLRAGTEGLFIWQVHCESASYRLKVVGSGGTETSCRISGTGEGFKSTPLFTFQPSDSVRFTAFKSGMYRNSTGFAPINGDTTIVVLSKPCPESPSVTDFDGNVYPTVLINGRCWMRENIRTKHYANGTVIPDGTGRGDISSEYHPRYWFVYNDNPSYEDTFGLLYTGWAALNGVFDRMTQGLCPNGWHISSNIEWCEMEQYLDPTVNPECMAWEGPIEGWVGTNIFPKLAEYGTDHWWFWGLIPYSSNESGFSGIGSGWRIDNGTFMGLPGNGMYYMSRVLGQNYDPVYIPRTRLCSGGYYSISRAWTDASLGMAVRCVKDN